MTRTLQLVFAVGLSACIGGYQSPPDNTAPTKPVTHPSTPPAPTTPPATQPSTPPAPTPTPTPSPAGCALDGAAAVRRERRADHHGRLLQRRLPRRHRHQPDQVRRRRPRRNLYANVLNYTAQLLGGNFDKSNAQILTKIAAGHNAVVYTPAQITSISNWLDAEFAGARRRHADGERA